MKNTQNALVAAIKKSLRANTDEQARQELAAFRERMQRIQEGKKVTYKLEG